MEYPTESVRLFTALMIPPDFAARIHALPRKGLQGSWVQPHDLHMTLRFLGDVDPARVPEIKAALSRVKASPFSIEVDGFGLFEKPSQNILYAKVTSLRKPENLCALIGEALTPLGFDFGTRPFVPHITLARLKRGDVATGYLRQHARALKGRFEADSFFLMASGAEADKGTRYRPLRQFKLTH